MFKKTCFNCGNKVDKIYNGLCEECFKTDNPPIKEIKPINIKYCNSCKKLAYSNQYYTQKEIEEKINDIVKKHTVLNDNYVLNSLEVTNFNIDGAKVNFDVEIDCDLNES